VQSYRLERAATIRPVGQFDNPAGVRAGHHRRDQSEDSKEARADRAASGRPLNGVHAYSSAPFASVMRSFSMQRTGVGVQKGRSALAPLMSPCPRARRVERPGIAHIREIPSSSFHRGSETLARRRAARWRMAMPRPDRWPCAALRCRARQDVVLVGRPSRPTRPACASQASIRSSCCESAPSSRRSVCGSPSS